MQRSHNNRYRWTCYYWRLHTARYITSGKSCICSNNCFPFSCTNKWAVEFMDLNKANVILPLTSFITEPVPAFMASSNAFWRGPLSSVPFGFTTKTFPQPMSWLFRLSSDKPDIPEINWSDLEPDKSRKTPAIKNKKFSVFSYS